MKISENITKIPAWKENALGDFTMKGNIYRDGILLDNELSGNCEWLYNPVQPDKRQR